MELSMQYSVIPSDTHTYLAFTWFEQDLDELLDNYLYFVSELLFKIYHSSDMSSNLGEDTNHYAVVYSLNCRKQKDSIIRHQSIQWRMMEECYRGIRNIRARYEWAKGYCRVHFNIPDTSCITEIKNMRKRGPCYKFREPYLQCSYPTTAVTNFK